MHYRYTYTIHIHLPPQGINHSILHPTILHMCLVGVREYFNHINQDYSQLAIIMVSVSVTFTAINYLLLISSIKKLRQLAQNKQKVKVYRQQQFTQIDSRDIVPGDVVAIEVK